MKTLLFLALLLPLAVGAQVKKCTIDGHTVYSDSRCGQYGATVNVAPNSIDTSAMREHAAKVEKQEKAEQARQQAQAARAAKRAGPCDYIPIPPGGSKEYRACMRKFTQESIKEMRRNR